MSMQQQFQSLIDFCSAPAADPAQGRILAFHLDPTQAPGDVYPYNGSAFIRSNVGILPFVVEGYGIRNDVFGHPSPNNFETVVHFSFFIGDPDQTQAILEFGGMNDFGGFNSADRSEAPQVTAEVALDDVVLIFDGPTGRRGATLRKTNYLHTGAA